MQDQEVGSPTKTSAHRKQRVREIRMKKLSSELLIRTMGVFLLWRKTPRTAMVRQAPTTAITVRDKPMASWDRNSTVLGMHLVPLSFDQKSSGQTVHSIESGES